MRLENSHSLGSKRAKERVLGDAPGEEERRNRPQGWQQRLTKALLRRSMCHEYNFILKESKKYVQKFVTQKENIRKTNIKKTSIIKLQLQKSISERPTSTRLKIRAYMTDMLRIIFTQ
jgi:hypothetical protein